MLENQRLLEEARASTAAWQADPGWQSLFHTVELHRFENEESQLYLMKRSIPPIDQAAIVEFTQGHPLALSLTADLWLQEQSTEITANMAATVRRILLKTPLCNLVLRCVVLGTVVGVR